MAVNREVAGSNPALTVFSLRIAPRNNGFFSHPQEMSIQQAQRNELVESVRKWVHFDNLTESLYKQAHNARTLRAQHEAQVIRLLEVSGMKNAQLQITGATLQCAQRSKPGDLTWGLLEEQLHAYFKTKGKPDETTAILEFIQSHRGNKTIDYLKKTTAAQ